MGLGTVNTESLTGEWGDQDVRRELERILSSRVFRGSRRCQAFLQYVVARTLDGDSKSLKERTVAVDVFGRDATEDLSDNSIVRVGAREVRNRLAQYYMDDGANDLLRIDLPAGSYIPTFQRHLPTAAVTDIESESFPEATKPDAPKRPQLIRRGRKAIMLGALSLIGCFALAVIWRVAWSPRNAFDVFWQPAFQEKKPLIIAMAHPIVYQPSLRAQQIDGSKHERPKPPIQRAINVPPELLNGSDFVPALNQYVGVGDAEAALRISSLFVQHRDEWRVRLASQMDFNDLRGSGAVLIGAYTNRWTMNLTANMRYRFEYGSEGKPCIAEAKGGCRWTLTTKADDGRSAEDYILLCRLPHSSTNGFTVVCAGLNVYGTQEAGRIISDPDSLTSLLRGLPKDWPNHNLEMVLHVAVVGDAPAQSELLSVYSW
jgi:hypothetical protein